MNINFIKQIIIFNILTLCLFTKHSLADQNKETIESNPLPTEKLNVSIKLKCAGLEIDEWREDTHFPDFTRKTPEGIAALNKFCLIALNKYPEFLKQNDLKFLKSKISAKITLAAANTFLDGKSPRNLNDVSGRMKIVVANCCIWGAWDSPTHRLFLRNDPIYFNDGKTIPNKYWERTFLHEMAHIMNDFYHVNTFNGLTKKHDEILAEEFVTWLGYDFKSESSSEDLSFKKKIKENLQEAKLLLKSSF